MFTIDKRPDLRYGFLCYLEETSLTPPAPPALTLVVSIACSLFVLFFRLPSFVFKRLQPLLPKHRGWGIPTPPLRQPSRTLRLCVILFPKGSTGGTALP